MGNWFGDEADPWNQVDDVAGDVGKAAGEAGRVLNMRPEMRESMRKDTDKKVRLSADSGPLALFGPPSGNVAGAAKGVTKAANLLSKTRATRRVAGVVGLDLASGQGPASNATEAYTDIETEKVLPNVAGDVSDFHDNQIPDDPDSVVPGWLQWLGNHPKVALTVVALLVVLQITGPATQLAANATEGE